VVVASSVSKRAKCRGWGPCGEERGEGAVQRAAASLSSPGGMIDYGRCLIKTTLCFDSFQEETHDDASLLTCVNRCSRLLAGEGRAAGRDHKNVERRGRARALCMLGVGIGKLATTYVSLFTYFALDPLLTSTTVAVPRNSLPRTTTSAGSRHTQTAALPQPSSPHCRPRSRLRCRHRLPTKSEPVVASRGGSSGTTALSVNVELSMRRAPPS